MSKAIEVPVSLKSGGYRARLLNGTVMFTAQDEWSIVFNGKKYTGLTITFRPLGAEKPRYQAVTTAWTDEKAWMIWERDITLIRPGYNATPSAKRKVIRDLVPEMHAWIQKDPIVKSLSKEHDQEVIQFQRTMLAMWLDTLAAATEQANGLIAKSFATNARLTDQEIRPVRSGVALPSYMM